MQVINNCLLLVFSLCLLSTDGLAFENPPFSLIDHDSLKTEKSADSLIRQINAKCRRPDEKSASMIKDITSYGFRDLFSKYSYNSQMPYSLQVNPEAEPFMRGYIERHGKKMVRMKDQALPYFNLIETILSQYGLPRELKYLAVIESGLQTGATSHAGAAGPWQFMPGTARSYGLKVAFRTDERRDFRKSTHAAAAMLLDLYTKWHDWLLVIAAYNGGDAYVKKAIAKSGSRNFWILQHFLPEESRIHVKKFIATHFIMENNGIVSENSMIKSNQTENEIIPAAGNSGIKSTEKAGTRSLPISGRYSSRCISEGLGMKLSAFDSYNPGFDQALNDGREYEMRLPDAMMEIFIQRRREILEACIQKMLSPEEITAPSTTRPQ